MIEYYPVTGGVPKYIELFRPSGDIFEVIKMNILSKQSLLYEEPIFQLLNQLPPGIIKLVKLREISELTRLELPNI